MTQGIYIGTTAPTIDSAMGLRAGEYVGDVLQRNPGVLQNLYMELTAGNIVETSSQITFDVKGGFAYNGYDNFAPVIVGYIAYYSDNTVYKTDAYIGFFTQTLSANKNKTHYAYSTFTLTKPSKTISILPYVQVGCINRWSADGTAGNDWTYFNTEYGIMCMSSDSSGGSKYTANTTIVTYNGIRREIPCYSLWGCSNTSNNANYANGYEVYSPFVSIYDSSGKPHYATNIYVYDSSGKPHKATAITVYDSSGKPHTMQM